MRYKYEFLLAAFVAFILALMPYLLILWIWGQDSAVLIVNGTGSLLLSLYVGWYIAREYKSWRRSMFPHYKAGVSLEASFKEIENENKSYAIEDMLLLHKETNHPRGYAWLHEDDISRALGEGYDPDQHFNFNVNERGIPRVTIKS